MTFLYHGRDKLTIAKPRTRSVARPRTPRANKFGAIRTEFDGQTFASKAEARRYAHLRLLQKIGEITDLETQPSFRLIVNDQKVCTYVADFRYRVVATGEIVVEDVKGGPTATPVFKLKVKLLKALHGVSVSVVN
jgi:hypothetical protein